MKGITRHHVKIPASESPSVIKVHFQKTRCNAEMNNYTQNIVKETPNVRCYASNFFARLV